MDVLYLDEVDSTNLYAKRNLKDLHDGTVVLAKHQFAGRGRLSRSWLDLGGENLFVSIVLKPSDSFNEKFANLTQYLSVTICKELEKYGIKPEIKWPNDVLVNGKKIAGILCETVMQGGAFKGLVLGFGINVSADNEAVKLVTDKQVTSLAVELGYEIDVNTFFNNLLNSFFNDYNKFLEAGFELIKHDYISRVNFLNKEISVQGFSDLKKGIAKAINNEGALLLQCDNKEFVLTIGDIL